MADEWARLLTRWTEAGALDEEHAARVRGGPRRFEPPAVADLDRAGVRRADAGRWCAAVRVGALGRIQLGVKKDGVLTPLDVNP